MGFRGDTIVKYVEVVSSGESMTMVVRISGGHCATIQAPMLIFSNENRSYLIRGLVDNIPKVLIERAQRVGWIKPSCPNIFWNPVHIKQIFIMKTIWLDNYSGHSMTPRLAAILAAKNIVFKFLPPCSTHLCQPADTFLISKIKDAWTRRWEAKKIELI